MLRRAKDRSITTSSRCFCRVLILAACVLPVAACNNKSPSRAETAAPAAETSSAKRESVVKQTSYADVLERVKPAVVTVTSERRVRAPQQFPFFDDPFLRGLFGGQSRG